MTIHRMRVTIEIDTTFDRHEFNKAIYASLITRDLFVPSSIGQVVLVTTDTATIPTALHPKD